MLFFLNSANLHFSFSGRFLYNLRPYFRFLSFSSLERFRLLSRALFSIFSLSFLICLADKLLTFYVCEKKCMRKINTTNAARLFVWLVSFMNYLKSLEINLNHLNYFKDNSFRYFFTLFQRYIKLLLKKKNWTIFYKIHKDKSFETWEL